MGLLSNLDIRFFPTWFSIMNFLSNVINVDDSQWYILYPEEKKKGYEREYIISHIFFMFLTCKIKCSSLRVTPVVFVSFKFRVTFLRNLTRINCMRYFIIKKFYFGEKLKNYTPLGYFYLSHIPTSSFLCIIRYIFDIIYIILLRIKLCIIKIYLSRHIRKKDIKRHLTRVHSEKTCRECLAHCYKVSLLQN